MDRGFADEARCDVSEEEPHCGEAAGNNYEVGFYETVGVFVRWEVEVKGWEGELHPDSR